MQRINPQISPNKSLTQTFDDMFGKYLTPINETYYAEAIYAEAMDDIQHDIIDERMDEIRDNNLITTDSPLEVELFTDNLKEWLELYYRLEKK